MIAAEPRALPLVVCAISGGAIEILHEHQPRDLIIGYTHHFENKAKTSFSF